MRLVRPRTKETGLYSHCRTSDAANSCYYLAWLLSQQKKHQEALAYAQRAYEGRLKVLGKDHHDTMESAQLVKGLKQLDEKV